MYVSLVFQAVFIGYSVGTAPIVGYHYGAQNVLELKGLLKKSLALLGAFAAAMFGASFLLARPLSFVFTGYDEGLLALTVRAFSLFAFSFLFSGYVIFGSSFFTALNNGLISAAISFMRTLVFQVAAVLRDVYGRTAVRSGGAFGLDEGWKELTNLDGDTSNTDPEGWVLE